MDVEKNGRAQAAIISAMLGCVTLALVNVGTEISESFKTFVHWKGKLWMPGAQGIGPYSGKETIALAVWLLSWLILARVLRDKEWNFRFVVVFFLLGMGIATTLIWPPVYMLFGHH